MYFANVTCRNLLLTFSQMSVFSVTVCFFPPRTTEVGCESDMEFLAKVHCVRQASEV